MPIKKLIVSITGRTKKGWQSKLKEINQYKIKEISLFLEALSPQNRAGLLEALKNSCVKKIPVVHIRNDITREEIFSYSNSLTHVTLLFTKIIFI